MLSQGVDALDAFTARAKELGLVVSEQDAKAGKSFEQAWGDLHDVIMSSVSAIGGALVPMITGLTNLIVKAVVVVRDWIKDHKALTMAIFMTSGAIVAAGIALKGLSVALNVVGMGVKALQLAFTGLSVAVGFISTLANPYVLLAAAIVGVLGYVAYLSGAFDGMGAAWGQLSKEVGSSISAIGSALSKGDISAAWRVVTALVKLEWEKVCLFFRERWEAFKSWFFKTNPDLAKNLINGFAAVGQFFSELCGKSSRCGARPSMRSPRRWSIGPSSTLALKQPR